MVYSRTNRNLSGSLSPQIPFCQLRASRAVTNFVCSYSLSFIVTLRVVIILLTAGFACNCKGFFATVSEANNCECNEQLTNRYLLRLEIVFIAVLVKVAEIIFQANERTVYHAVKRAFGNHDRHTGCKRDQLVKSAQ